MDTITDDILAAILLRLPSKTISKLRCVSKLWYKISSSPNFIQLHLSLSKLKNNDQLLVTYVNERHTGCRYSVRDVRCPNVEICGLTPPLSGLLRIVGACDGLVVMVRDDVDVFVWNLSLEALRMLPDSLLGMNKHGHLSHVGFGYDCAGAGDYKVVRFTRVVVDLIGILTECYRAEVFGLRGDYWRLISSHVPSRINHIMRGVAPVVNGRVHWFAYAHEVGCVLWFDLTSETFGEMLVPDCREGCLLKLSSLEGRLCLFSYKLNTPCEVWVMDCGSWEKHCVLRDILDMVGPVGCALNGEFLLYRQCDALVVYNSSSGKIKKFCIPELCFFLEAVPYVDSLVWFPSALGVQVKGSQSQSNKP